MTREEKVFEKLGSLVLETIFFLPFFYSCLPVDKFMLFILQFPLCIHSRGSTRIDSSYIPALQNDLKWLVLYQKRWLYGLTPCLPQKKNVFLQCFWRGKFFWILLGCVTADCILCYCLKSLYWWIPVQDSGIWEEEQQLIFSGFLVTTLEFTVSKRFVLTEYQDVNYLLNASISIVVSVM